MRLPTPAPLHRLACRRRCAGWPRAGLALLAQLAATALVAATASAQPSAAAAGARPATVQAVKAPAHAASPEAGSAAPAADDAVLSGQGGIRIHVAGRPLSDVIQRLARATGTALHVAEGASDSPSPLTLHWQGQRRQDAWSQVLAGSSNYALQCDEQACQLWLHAGAGAQAAARPPAPNPPKADPEGLFPADG